MLSSWVVSGNRQFWVGGNFAPIQILQTPVTEQVTQSYLTNTGTDDTDWIAGIKTLTPGNPDVIKNYTVYGDGRTTQVLSAIESGILYYAGDGFWTSSPIEPPYDSYLNNPPPLPTTLRHPVYFTGWRIVGSDYYFQYGTGAGYPYDFHAPLEFDAVLVSMQPFRTPPAGHLTAGWFTATFDLGFNYNMAARDRTTSLLYPNAPLTSTSTQSATYTGWPSVQNSYTFTGTNQKDASVSLNASYSGRFQGNPSMSYYNPDTGDLILPGNYPMTAPDFISIFIDSQNIVQNSQHPSWSLYNGSSTIHQGITAVNATTERKTTIAAPSVAYAQIYNNAYFDFVSDTYDPYIIETTNGAGAPKNGTYERRITYSGTRNYNGEVYITPVRAESVYYETTFDRYTTDSAYMRVTTTQTGDLKQKITVPQTNTGWDKEYVRTIEVNHHYDTVSVYLEGTRDSRNNQFAPLNFKTKLFDANNNTTIEINRQPPSGQQNDPSWEYAYGHYHAAQWIDATKYYWLIMPADMGTGFDDSQFWDEVAFPAHTVFATNVLRNGYSWTPKEYNFDSTDSRFKETQEFSAIASEVFPMPGNASEQRIYDARYSRG